MIILLFLILKIDQKIHVCVSNWFLKAGNGVYSFGVNHVQMNANDLIEHTFKHILIKHTP